MPNDCKIIIPDGTWALSGDAALDGNAVKVGAVPTYSEDFESYSDGELPAGWVEVVGTFRVATYLGQKACRILPPVNWGGAYYGGQQFNEGTLEVECLGATSRYNPFINFNPSVASGYALQLLPGSGSYVYSGGLPTNFVGLNTPQLIERLGPVENPTPPFLLKIHKYKRPAGAMEIRKWIDGDLVGDALEVDEKWEDYYLGIQGYLSAYYGHVKFYEMKTGGFSFTVTPYQLTKLLRIGISARLQAAIKKSLSEILEYKLDGGSWFPVPDDGYINAAATTSLSVRSNLKLTNDFDASDSLYVDAVSMEIEGQWDAPATPPDTPTNPGANPLTDSAIRVTWEDSVTSNVIYNRIYRNTANDFGTAELCGFALQGAEHFHATGLDPDTKYWFWIVAIDENNVASSETTGVDATTYEADQALNLSAVQKALYDWAVRITNGTVIFDYEDGTKPEKPFVTMNLIGPMKPSFTDSVRGKDTGDLDFEQSGQRAFTVSLNVYDDKDAITWATKLQASLDNPVEIGILSEADIGVGDVGDINDLTEILETKHERRAQFDFTIFVAVNILFTNYIIEDVNYQNNI